MEISDIKKIIESLLFVSDKPLLNREIKAVIKEELPENVKIEDIMKEIQQEYIQLNRAFELKFVADGWTFATKPEYSNWIKKLLKEKTILKLSPSAMEVLAIIAYKQPITRAEIDNVRGVDSGGVIDTLTDRKFIKIVGRKETLGRPLLYGTTQEFLRHFGLSHLSELPVIETAKDILPDQQESVQELPFDDKTDTDNSNTFTEKDIIKQEKSEQDNDNFANEGIVLSNETKNNSVDVVTKNLNDEQNNTEN
jgi:segregation and condensation protein B